MKNLYIVTAYWRGFHYHEPNDHQYCVGITSDEAVARECAATYAADPANRHDRDYDDDVQFDVVVDVYVTEDGVSWKEPPRPPSTVSEEPQPPLTGQKET